MIRDAVIGATATAVAIGLMAVTDAGTDLSRACMLIAAALFVAGAAAPRRDRRRFAARVAALIVGACAPIAVLAVTGVTFTNAPWSLGLVLSASVFAVVGAAARTLVATRARGQAAALAIGAWLAMIAVAPRIVGAVVSSGATTAMAAPIEPFAFVGADGAELRSLDARGRVIVVAFWATWCASCRAELPELTALVDHYRGDPRVVVWWVNTERSGDTPAAASEFAKANHVTLPLVFDRHGAETALGGPGMPAIALIGRDGLLHGRHIGFDASESLADQLERTIDRLLVE